MIVDGIKITGITSYSKKVKDGYVFVAIEGEKHDGNDFIDEAIDRGAVLIYTEKDIKKKDISVIRVDNARIKLAQLLNAYYDYPAKKLSLIGVTGTNGKTTTTHFIETIFREAGYKTGLIGTVGVKINEEWLPPTLTTPEPEVLFYNLNKMIRQDVEVVVMEVSSHGLKFHRTYGLEFDVAVHTNIEKDHMNLHHTIEDYVNTKKKLFDALSKNKIAVINIDDQYANKLVEDNNQALVLTYGLNKKATLTASSLDVGTDIRFTACVQRGITAMNGITTEPSEFLIKLNLMGRHNIYNALAATATALAYGIDMEVIKSAFTKVRAIHRRLEKIYDADFLVIDDFSHNPASYEAVFETFQSLEYSKLIVVNAIRGNRGIEINRDNADIFTSWIPLLNVSHLILTLCQDKVDESNKVFKEELLVYRRILEEEEVPYEVYDTLEGAIGRALDMVEKNDIILLLGPQGMEKGREVLYQLLIKG